MTEKEVVIPLKTDLGMPVEFSTSHGGVHPILMSVQCFQSWLQFISRKHQVDFNHSDKSIIHINENISRRFCLGIAENRIFLGIQPNEMKWFKGIPWLHVALRKNSQKINIVCEETTIDNVTIPYFAIALNTSSAEKINKLTKYHYLDVRLIQLDASGTVRGVSQFVSTTLSIIVVNEDENLISLLADKVGKSSSNRSKFRSVYR